ncbi:MAG TPA: rRNA maturation RNase YbeY [Nitrospiraceae bacterium]|nr:rRNA maturation RNase YbeY [Nitrospiraceae bacterium]
MPVLVRSWLRHKLIFLPKIQSLAQKILTAAGVPEAELSLDLVGDRRIRRLNQRYRGRDYPTDVLAFPMREAPTSVRRQASGVKRETLGLKRKGAGDLSVVTPYASPLTSEMLGDVVISLQTAVRQAEASGHSLDLEVVMLLIHGTLHLCGYDHERGAHEARRMRRKERAILESLKPLPRMFKRRPSSVIRQRSLV